MRKSKAWKLVAMSFTAAAVHAQTVSGIVPAGTRLRARLETPVDTKTSRVADGVEARLLEPVKIHDQTMLPVGTRLSGRVAAVRPGSHKDKVFAFFRLALTAPLCRTAVPSTLRCWCKIWACCSTWRTRGSL